jgi:ABC-type branched-subunit amino acid transport system ATPase component
MPDEHEFDIAGPDVTTDPAMPAPTRPAFDVDVEASRRALADLERTPGVAKPDPILKADGIVRTFGGLKAVDVGHLEVQRGVITALIGPNGAGKTTLFNLLTGFDRPDHGSWSFNGRSLNRVPAYKVARRGMVRTFQLTKVLSKLTVIENMRVGATGQRGEGVLAAMIAPLWRSQEEDNTTRADALLERFLLDKKREDFAGSLSGGQRKLLEMARSLMTEPELVMLDEPMAGVNPALKQSLLGHVKSLREEGRTVLFVEHDMDMVRDISDWVVVMAQGRIVAEGPPDAVMADPAVIDAYLGAHHDVELTFEEEERILAEAEAEIGQEAQSNE